MNILIVEDNPIYQIKLRNVVEQMKFKVSGITSSVAETAVCFSSSEHFDLLICDVVLKDGIVFDIVPWPDIPTLFITSMEEKDFMENSLKIKKSWFIVKPFADLSLISAITKLIENFVKPDLFITVFGKHKNPIKLPLDDILYIESEGNYSTVVTNNHIKYAVKRSAKLLIDEVNEDFVRIRRATFINKSKITKVSMPENKVYIGTYSFIFTKEFKKNMYEFHYLA